ncbi:MAG: GcrA family cell cycle regulator [Terricaulis sp.]
MNRTGMAWSESEVALLRKLWTEGLSAGQISKQLPGRSRNACIGVGHRLGLPQRVTGGRAYVPRTAMRRTPRPSARPFEPKPLPARNMHVTSVKPIPVPEKKPNKFDDSPASQAAAALLGAAYKREGLSL